MHTPNPHIPIACDRANSALAKTRALRGVINPEAAFFIGLALQKWLFIPASIARRAEIEEKLIGSGQALIEILISNNVGLTCLSEICLDWVDAVDTPAFSAMLDRYCEAKGPKLSFLCRNYTEEVLARSIATFIDSMADDGDTNQELWDRFEDCAREEIELINLPDIPQRGKKTVDRLASAERSYLSDRYTAGATAIDS